MSGYDALKTAIENAETTYNRKREQYDRLADELRNDLARLDGMRVSLDIVQRDEKGPDANFTLTNTSADLTTGHLKAEKQRRYRLGAKKRVVYQLVANGASTLDIIEAAVFPVNIDHRYIIDVVRVAMRKGDMQGDVKKEFSITDSGMEILKKAPLPKEWDSFKIAIKEQEAPDNQEPGASNFTEEATTSSNESEDNFAEFRQVRTQYRGG